jgi:hypothetical protein
MSGAQALLRFSRDRRGYEHLYLVEPDRHGRGRERILYWFRSPPGIKVGRAPFDEELKRKIEAQNPGVSFDWPRLLATPIPPPTADVERWRERRQTERAEKAARAARRADLDPEEPDAEPPEQEEGTAGEPDPVGSEAAPDSAASQPQSANEGQPAASPEGQVRRRRRRRRRGRGHRDAAPAPAAEPPPPAGGGDSSNE